MIERRRIGIEDRAVFDRYIHEEDNSTYNFTNMFMWENDGGITYAEVADCLVIFFQGGNHPVSASYPVGQGDKKKAISFVSDYIRSLGLTPVFRNLSQSMVEELQQLMPDSFTFVEDRNAADYIYETESLITLAGKQLHGKRNHYNYFKNHYDYTYKRLEKDDIGDCLSLYEAWEAEKEESRFMDGSNRAVKRLLKHFEDLPVIGGGIYVDNCLAAFSVGETVKSDTALIHIEFATELRGAFNTINREFCAHEWADFPYVNREEDMGLSGLRQAKLAYRPCRLLSKFNAVLKERR